MPDSYTKTRAKVKITKIKSLFIDMLFVLLIANRHSNISALQVRVAGPLAPAAFLFT
jgi:hypothetical protein